MSFGRRLGLFFILIALVPTLALAGMLLFVSEDSREGKADARLAAGLETALAVYDGSVGAARPQAQGLARDPALARALREGPQALERFAQASLQSDVIAVAVTDPGGASIASAGAEDAVAFAEVPLEAAGEPLGSLLASVTTAPEYASEVRRLTQRELVVSREGEALSATVEPPSTPPEEGETLDLALGEGEFRARLVSLDPNREETLLFLGPAKEGGLLTVGRPAGVILILFLLLGLVFAYALARALTGLHTRVAEQAVTDALTGLSNRRRFEEMLDKEVARSMRFGHSLSLLIVDVDDFKRINDERGHPQGDAVLEALGDLVRRSTRAIDIGARYGGDELALILLETDTDGARVLADRLREGVVEQRVQGHDGSTFDYTISVGVATLPDSAENSDALVEAADKALLRAKRAGKNRIQQAPKRRKRKARPAG